jgi:hypothetical protein
MEKTSKFMEKISGMSFIILSKVTGHAGDFGLPKSTKNR